VVGDGVEMDNNCAPTISQLPPVLVPNNPSKPPTIEDVKLADSFEKTVKKLRQANVAVCTQKELVDTIIYNHVVKHDYATSVGLIPSPSVTSAVSGQADREKGGSTRETIAVEGPPVWFQDAVQQVISPHINNLTNAINSINNTLSNANHALNKLNASIDRLTIQGQVLQAKVINATAIRDGDAIVALPNNAGALPAHFPETRRAMAVLGNDEVALLLNHYGIGPNANALQRKNILRAYCGVPLPEFN